LNALGVEVTGSAATGWRLVGDVDLTLPELLEPKIAETVFAGGVRHFGKIDSTNAAAMRAGAECWAQASAQDETADSERVAGHGSVWLAEEQTAGKGRAGHDWQSQPRDGIYCSVLLRPRLAPAEVIILSLAAGLAVVEAVHEVTGLWSDLRWPNDVLLGGRKFCGILTELNAEVTRVRYVVVGMGLNVNHAEFPPELAPIATSLYREMGKKVSRVELAAALLRALHREQEALQNGAAAAQERILRRFEQHSSYCCGAAVTVEEDGGYQGVTCGLDDRGFLRVEAADGVRTVLSGGVRKREAQPGERNAAADTSRVSQAALDAADGTKAVAAESASKAEPVFVARDFVSRSKDRGSETVSEERMRHLRKK
jgi:BirA family biotin operon repressor/biotin-[acetyl-CoA-carboxylase] ligase